MAKTMDEQMELFEDGGLKDEGGTVDPVSGNDVPPGSTQEEVRDDIPAQLSEGEFVFPADVVRYIGLEKLMQMRQEAKMGLRMMDEMGQMGNSEEATIPDDMPFDINDLDMEDEPQYNMAVGGFVPNPQTGTYQLPQTGVMQYQPSQFANYQQQYTPYQMPQMQTQPYFMPTAAYTPPQQQFVPTAPVPEVMPTFQDLIPSPEGKYDEIKEYENKETGEKMNIPFVDGKPIFPIPTGFTEVIKETVEATETPTAVTPTAQVRKPEGDGGPDSDVTTGSTLTLGGETYGPKTGGGIPGTIYAGPTQRTKGTAANPQMTFQLNFQTAGMIPGLASVAQMVTKKDVFKEDDVVQMTPETSPGKASNVTINMPGLSYNDIRAKTTGVKQQEIVSVAQTLVDTYSNRPNDNFEVDYDAAKSLHDNKDKITGGRPVKDPEAQKAMQEVAFGLSQMTSEEIDKFNDYMSQPADKDGPSDSGPQMGANVGSKDFGTSYDPGGTADPGQEKDFSGYSSQALGDRTSGRVGFNKGGKPTKKMKRGGLASKK